MLSCITSQFTIHNDNNHNAISLNTIMKIFSNFTNNYLSIKITENYLKTKHYK